MGAAFGAQVDGALDGSRFSSRFSPGIKWEEDAVGTRTADGFDTDRVVVREAIGVVGAITPWNVPFYINFAKVVSGACWRAARRF